jgi:altronate dehydratase small subunit
MPLLQEKAIVLDPKDNVATAKVEIKAGAVIIGDEGREIKILEDIPFAHKFALEDIPSGEPIIKYGQTIGRAIQDIKVGELIHIHNLESLRGRGDKKIITS